MPAKWVGHHRLWIWRTGSSGVYNLERNGSLMSGPGEIWNRYANKKTVWKEMWLAIAGWLLLSGLLIALLPESLLLKVFSSNNLFHYVMGTKYFDELGYFDFYEGILLADEEIDGIADVEPVPVANECRVLHSGPDGILED